MHQQFLILHVRELKKMASQYKVTEGNDTFTLTGTPEPLTQVQVVTLS